MTVTGTALTWLVQTLLNATNANVCASIVLGRSRFASTSGISSAERKSWGMKARDPMRRLLPKACPKDAEVEVAVEVAGGEE